MVSDFERKIRIGKVGDCMASRDWERFGEEIFRTVQDAVEYGNYDRLNQTIKNTVNQATDWVGRNAANRSNQRMGSYGSYNYGNNQSHSYGAKRNQPPENFNTQYKVSKIYEMNRGSKIKSLLLAGIGYGVGAIMIVFAVMLLFGAMLVGDMEFGMISTVFNLLVIGVCGFMAYKGTAALTRNKRFKTYIDEIGNAEFCNISELAESVSKPFKFVVKDIEWMIDNGWFRQGHLDRQKTCLIVTDRMYHQYQQLEDKKEMHRREEEERAQRQRADAAKRQEEERKAQQIQAAYRKGLSPEVQKVIEQGDAYVKKIRECNDAIPGEEISAKISRMEMLVDKIFDRVEQNPESVSDIKKLMDYYLPTTVKLLEAYADMDAQPVGGENIQTAKKEIEDTLDTLNIAFEKLLDSLFQDAAWDVSSDISVLNAMLVQEGLKDDGLKKK